MTATKHTKERHDVENIVRKLLQTGIIVSSLIIIVGFIWFLISGESGYPDESYPSSFMAIFSGLVVFKPFAIVMFGLFCLILTPILRVILSFFIFLKEKDYPYMVITATVLTILIISFFVGKN